MKSLGLLFVLVLSACGDDGATKLPDAPIPPDAAPDASTCAAPKKQCGNTCLDVSTDEENCGDCGVACNGGEVCNATCACAPAFIPATFTPSGFDQFQGAGGIQLAIGPVLDTGGINPIIIGYALDTPLSTDIDLSTVALGDAPFIAAGYHADIQAMTVEASYVATAGTLRITNACDTEIEGTLTNATFRGVNGGLMNPSIDPNGCTVSNVTMTFHIATAPCPAPAVAPKH